MCEYENEYTMAYNEGYDAGYEMALSKIKEILDDPKYSMRGALEKINKIIKESGV